MIELLTEYSQLIKILMGCAVGLAFGNALSKILFIWPTLRRGEKIVIVLVGAVMLTAFASPFLVEFTYTPYGAEKTSLNLQSVTHGNQHPARVDIYAPGDEL